MAKREAALSGGDGGIVSVATCKDLGHKRIELSVVASKAKQSNGLEFFMILGFLARCLPRSLAVLARKDMSLCHCEHSLECAAIKRL